MLRILIAGFLGGVVLFAWGAIAWMVLHLHDDSIHSLPDEERVSVILRESVTEPGAYRLPGFPDEHDEMTDEEREQARDAWAERYEEGPVGMLFIQPDGKTAFHWMYYLIGFVINLITAFIVAVILAAAAKSLPGYVGRVLFVLAIGLIIAVYSNGSFWNWMNAPTDFTLMMSLDDVIGFTLLGLAVGAVIRPKSD